MPFQKGQSGNPAGRPQGSRNKVTLALDAMLEGEAAAVLRTLIDAAMDGDTQAAKALLDRVYPKRKHGAVVVDGFDADAPVPDQARAILIAVTSGHMSAPEAVALLEALTAHTRTLAAEESREQNKRFFDGLNPQ